MNTTIKLDVLVRDDLKVQADLAGRTLGQQVAHLVAQEARRERFDALRSAIQSSPPDRAYLENLAAWEALSADGLAGW